MAKGITKIRLQNFRGASRPFEIGLNVDMPIRLRIVPPLLNFTHF
jgi:hypothetical protein